MFVGRQVVDLMTTVIIDISGLTFRLILLIWKSKISSIIQSWTFQQNTDLCYSPPLYFTKLLPHHLLIKTWNSRLVLSQIYLCVVYFSSLTTIIHLILYSLISAYDIELNRTTLYCCNVRFSAQIIYNGK